MQLFYCEGGLLNSGHKYLHKFTNCKLQRHKTPRCGCKSHNLLCIFIYIYMYIHCSFISVTACNNKVFEFLVLKAKDHFHKGSSSCKSVDALQADVSVDVYTVF